jgi:hypothetical protein
MAICAGADLKPIAALAAVVLIPLVASMVLHAGDYDLFQLVRTLTRIAACGLYVLLAAFLLHHPRADDLLRVAFVVLGGLSALLFLFMSATDPQWASPTRFKPGGLHPNWWGEQFIIMTLALAMVKPRWLFYGALPFVALGLFLVQARAAMISSLIVLGFAVLAREGLGRLVVMATAALLVLVPGALGVDAVAFEGRHAEALVAFVANDVLLLNDPYRGLETGISGRGEGYVDALTTFAAQPFAGVGFGLGDVAVRESSGHQIHNGHLALLMDLGVLLYPFIFVVMAGAVVRALRARTWLVLGMILAYMFYVSFAPRSINVSVLAMTGWIMMVTAWAAPRIDLLGARRADGGRGDDRAPPRPATAPTGARRIGDRWRTGLSRSPA